LRFTAYLLLLWAVVQTAAAISTVVMAAAVFPDAQRRVQEELDLVLGPGKAPTFEDMKILPQTHAFVLETYRWRPVSVGGTYASLSLPHRIVSLETW
jgi:cytochrome P450